MEKVSLRILITYNGLKKFFIFNKELSLEENINLIKLKFGIVGDDFFSIRNLLHDILIEDVNEILENDTLVLTDKSNIKEEINLNILENLEENISTNKVKDEFSSFPLVREEEEKRDDLITIAIGFLISDQFKSKDRGISKRCKILG